MIRKPFIGLCFAAFAVIGCGKGGDGDVLAVVNGETIPMAEYFKTMERKSRVTAMVDPQTMRVDQSSGRIAPQVIVVQVQPSIAFQALQDCIVNTVVKQLAVDEGVYPSEADIEKEIKLQEIRRPTLVKDLSGEGLSIDQIKHDLGISLAQHNLKSKGVTVTNEEVQTYIKENPKEFTVPASAELLYMEVQDDKTRDLADKELKEGQLFAAVAQHYSLQPEGKEKQFRFPISNISQMNPTIQKLVGATRELTASTWIQDPQSKRWFKFYVGRKTPAKLATLDEFAKELVKRALKERKGGRANDLDKRVIEKLKGASIAIEVKYLQEPWKKAFENLTKSANAKPTGN
ncbi:MAG: SurA N-terminal domain-containing protein [Chlorobia bacterium]|nr:SurA N-terminal domain-containing protein [Fimbriimonadaceae bacterium]